MSPIPRALIKALLSLAHPRMFLLMLFPVATAVLVWIVAGVTFWAQAVSWLDAEMRGWDTLQWLLAYWPLTLLAAHAAWATLFLLMVPVVIIVTVVVVGIFAMPVMVAHVAARDYAQLDERHGGGFAQSVWNSALAVVWFVVLLLITLPLWLIPPAWPLITLGLLGYLNQRVFRFDALAAHASAKELSHIVRRERWSLFALGVAVALAAHVPILGFFVPVYGGLVFIHFGLDRLRRLRDQPIEAEWQRVSN